jgi:hypothetical protein
MTQITSFLLHFPLKSGSGKTASLEEYSTGESILNVPGDKSYMSHMFMYYPNNLSCNRVGSLEWRPISPLLMTDDCKV